MSENIYNILEAKKQRVALVKQAREILDKADKEKRGMTAEEEEKYNKIDMEIDAIGKRIEKEERMREIEKITETQSVPVAGKDNLPVADKKDFRASDEYRSTFRKYLVSGITSLSSDEVRALQADDPILGGYMIAPQQFIAELLKGIDNAVYVRKYATIYQLTQSESLGVPTMDSDVDDADWTTELATGNEDTGLKIGKRELKPNPLAKRVKVSNKLLRISAIDPETLIRQRLEYKFGVTLEKAYMTGDGNLKPLGLFTASADGIPTDRDVNCGMKENEGNSIYISADGLIDVKYALKSAYWKRAVWVMHRDVVSQIRKLKTGLGTYVWQPGLTATQPDTLLDSPIIVSEYAPNSLTENSYVCLYGDLSFYWIVDALGFTIQRLIELYAEKNQTGFIGRYEGDGMPVLAEAFVRGKLTEIV